MRRSAFTLLEVMVAIALTLVIAGLVFWATNSAVGDAALREAVGQTSAAMGLARAEAQRRGRVVEVQVRQASPGQWELATLVWDERGRPEGPPGERAGAAERQADEPAKTEVDAIDLPRGVSVRIPQPASEPAGGDVKRPESVSTDLAATLVLAVFLPDGSGSMLARELVGSQGAPVALAMNRWTGEVSVLPVAQPVSRPTGSEAVP